MSLLDWLKDQFSTDAIQRTRIPISVQNDLTSKSGVIAKADQHYVRLWFSELFLQRNTEWFTTRFPLGYSLVSLKFGDEPKVEFANVAGKNKFDIGQVNQDRSVMRNFPMTPLLPFRGGDIEMDCGLVSMEAGNLLESFAKTVGDIAAKLNIPQASSVITIASSIATGVQELLGTGKSKTMLTAHDMFTGQTLTSGYALLSSRPRSEFEGKTVWITPDGVRLGSSKDALSPLQPQDFLVVFVECITTRDDWQSFSAIGGPLDKAIEAKLGGREDEAKLLLVQAKVAAMTSPDLTRNDAKRVVAAVQSYFNDEAGITETVNKIAINAGNESAFSDSDGPYMHFAQAMDLHGR